MTTLDHALRYAAEGLAVLPLHSIRNGRCTCGHDCGSPGKHPRTDHGKDDATTDPPQVTAWWDRWPTANIGARPPTGLIVLDVDPRNGGAGELLKLTRQHRDLPATLTARTGSGGLHIWLAHSGPTRGQLCPGVDIKTSSGYVVAPPSLHASGRRYEWVNPGTPIAPVPDWIATTLRPPTPPQPAPPERVTSGGTPALAGLLRVVLNAQPGGRNNALHWASCRMFEKVRAGKVAEPPAIGMLLDAAAVVGLGEHEAQNSIGSARRAVLG